jgi:hypothetical protein
MKTQTRQRAAAKDAAVDAELLLWLLDHLNAQVKIAEAITQAHQLTQDSGNHPFMVGQVTVLRIALDGHLKALKDIQHCAQAMHTASNKRGRSHA